MLFKKDKKYLWSQSQVNQKIIKTAASCLLKISLIASKINGIGKDLKNIIKKLIIFLLYLFVIKLDENSEVQKAKKEPINVPKIVYFIVSHNKLKLKLQSEKFG